jgi:methyl-accepting chemotaxis protein
LQARNALPRGSTLPHEAWRRRHRWMLALLLVHVVALPLYAMSQGHAVGHALLEAAPLVVAALVGASCPNRRLAATGVVLGLLTCSALAVHLSGAAEAQGYLFNRPVEADEFAARFRTGLAAPA